MITIPSFDGSREKFRAFKQAIFNAALNGSPTSPQGLLGDVMSAAEWTQHQALLLAMGDPNVQPDPYVAVAHPGNIAAAGNAHAIAVYKINLEQFNTYRTNLSSLKQAIIVSLDSTSSVTVAGVDGGFFTSSCRQIVERLTIQYGVFRASDLHEVGQDIQAIYHRRQEFREFITILEQKYDLLQRAGHPESERSKVSNLKKSLIPSGLFAEAMSIWFVQNGDIALQTFAAFSAAMILHDGNRDPEPMSEPAMDPSTISTLMAESAEKRAYEKGKKDARAEAKATAASSARSGSPPRRPFDFYCWSHGPNRSHNGNDCRYRKTGHVAGATAANKQGGKA
jgi:hypothetical protein